LIPAKRELLKIAIEAYREKDTIDQSDTDLIVEIIEEWLEETETNVLLQEYIEQRDWA
jgi:hypothetical protein